MSYSVCLKCGKMVGWYDKYCPVCQKKFGLPDIRDWQKNNHPDISDNYKKWAKKEVKKDFAQAIAKKLGSKL